MTRKRTLREAGTVVVLEHISRVLADNPLGDPRTRQLAVWLPHQYDVAASFRRGPRFPVLYDLAGFTSSGIAQVGWRPFGENVAERVARLVHEKKLGPVIVVFPDCFTAYGGNQYINSTAIGRYADYLLDEIIPFVDHEFRTLASREHRGCFGRSSGGYGAIVHAMLYPQYWGAIANHSGDAGFDLLYRSDWPNTLDELARYRRPARAAGSIAQSDSSERQLRAGCDDGRIRRFLAAHWARDKHGTGEGHALMNIAMAATYDPDPKAPLGFRVPFHMDTGELIARRWQRWLDHDPVHMVRRHARNLRQLRGLFLDCGSRDQYHIHYGARQLSRALRAARVAHHYEEFDDNHSGIDYRFDVSLPFLYQALRP